MELKMKDQPNKPSTSAKKDQTSQRLTLAINQKKIIESENQDLKKKIS